MKKLILLPVVCLALVNNGCALLLVGGATAGVVAHSKHEAYKSNQLSEKLNTWVGVQEDLLIASWGVPGNVYNMVSGKRVIEYERGRNVEIGGFTYTERQTTTHRGAVGLVGYSGTSTEYVTKKTSVHDIKLICKTDFIIDGNGRIESWRLEGNDCE